MDLSKILAISGKPGLFHLLSQTKTGFIVESLADGRRMPVFAHERVSSLEEISIFSTKDEDLPLKEVFRKMFEHTGGKPGPDNNATSAELRSFFEAVVPDYDPERVYASDMKKAISWYNLLAEKGLLDFTEEPEESRENPETEETPSAEKE